MRLGAPVAKFDGDVDSWISTLKRSGYTAAYSPIGPDASDDLVRAVRDAAGKADIVIAEVGAWSNPISPVDADANSAIEKCISSLALADRLGATCCVNIAGSRNGGQWDGPHADNFSNDTFDLIVETTRKIIDAVKPKTSFYTLETMPWIFPSSPDEYLDLVKAIDRPQMAVHLDPVNMLNSPRLALANGKFIEECFDKLGDRIKSCHGKDIVLSPNLTTHLDEARPGLGILDYRVFLRQLSRLPADTPLLLEHLPDEEYPAGYDYIRGVARDLSVKIVGL